jgi:glycosyltransferase involved in cell wall biosynthesis
MSYWRYQAWLFGGDPYFSPNLSLDSRKPELRQPNDRTLSEMISPALGRTVAVFRQRADAGEAAAYADVCRATDDDVDAIRALHEERRAPFAPRTINWFIPDLDNPFYGGINTVFRMADYLKREHDVENQFIVWGPGPEKYVRSGIEAAFPAIADSLIAFHDGSLRASMVGLPPADVSVATLWVTAYQLAHFPDTKRKFYLVQDFEPIFNPAGTMYALAEESYRLGLYGLCNSPTMGRIYREEYGGIAHSFTPAVDRTIFHPNGRPIRTPDAPITIFVYARAGHWRNCWELVSLSLKELKNRLGDRIRIIAAGSWARPDDPELDAMVKHIGLVDYHATGPLYRSCDIGLAPTVSKHPSYLPLELMACGVPVVAFDSPDFAWLLRDGENCLLTKRTVDGVTDALERLVIDTGLRERLAKQGIADVEARHNSWDAALAGIYEFLSDPERGA